MNSFIRERENGKFQAIISYKNGSKWKQKSKGGFNTKKEAKEWIKKATFEVLDLERKNIIDSDMTFKELGELYIEDLKIRNLKPNTIIAAENSIKVFSDFNDIPINKINPYDIKKYIYNQRNKTGYSYHISIKKLKSVFNFAIRELKILSFNPISDLKVEKNEDARIKFIDKNLYEEILSNAKNDKYKLAIETLYCTGVRVGELLGITPFSLLNNTIKITQQYDYRLKQFAPLKTTNSYRTIPINSNLYKKLQLANTDKSGRIFHEVQLEDLKKFLREYKTSAHCFRHTFATNLLSSGIDVTIAAAIVGDNVDTMLKTYVETNKDREIESYERIRAIF